MTTNFEEQVVALAASAAYQTYVDEDVELPETAEEVAEGAPFAIDVVIPVGKDSGDGRRLLPGSLSTRELPIPLLWQPKTGSGHDGSYVVGRIDTCDVIDDQGIVNARGVFDTGPFGREAERLVRNGFLRGISADLDMFEAVEDEDEMSALSEEFGEDFSEKMIIKKARAMASTLLPKPAFQECNLRILDAFDAEEELELVDGIHEADVELGDDSETVVASLIASGIPVAPPKEWFVNPKFKTATPLTVEEGGRVFGHIATWTQDHIGYNFQVKPPRSRSNYAYFHTGVVRTSEGEDVAVGQLTMAGGHAPLDVSDAQAVEHYDNTGSAVADLHVGEDSHGIWVAGALRPGVSPQQIRTIRASAPSGDWRPIRNRLELVAVLQVNVPGFPTPRACVAGGQITSLVAAGAPDLYRLKTHDFSDLSTRVMELETQRLEDKKALAVARVDALREEKRAALVASAEAIKERFKPVIEQRDATNAELQARAEELALRVKGKWNEKLHPRDDEGKWRDVLVRLSDLLNDDDDTGAVDAVRRAADAEDSGDSSGATDAGREARVSLQEALKRVEDPETKSHISDALDEVDNAIDEPKEGSEETLFEEGLRRMVAEFLDKLTNNIDPKTMADRAYNRLKSYVDGNGFESPEEIAHLMTEILRKDILPTSVQ